MDRQHRLRICITVFLVLLCSPWTRSGEPLAASSSGEKIAFSIGARAELGPVIAEGNGHRVHAGPPEGLSWIDDLPGRGDGGGADVIGPLTVIQTHYSDPINGNVVLLLWGENTANGEGVDILIDGELRATVVPPPSEFAFITDVEPGPHVFVVREANAPEGTSAEGSLSVAEVQPFADATALGCSGIPGDDPLRCSLVVEWTNPGPVPSYYLFFLDDEDDGWQVDGDGSLVIDSVGAGSHDLTLLGFAEETPGNPLSLYRGEFVESSCELSCEFQPRRFLRGLCGDGTGIPDLSSAVFLLNFLFLGGAKPSCLEACDADADRALDLSDAVYLLNFLFLGGRPPPTWPDVDLDGDGRRDATCEEAPEDRCRNSQEACS